MRQQPRPEAALSRRPQRVVLLNNYPEGKYPAQHLWGMWETIDDHDWRIAAPPCRAPRFPLQERWTRRKAPLLGDLG